MQNSTLSQDQHQNQAEPYYEDNTEDNGGAENNESNLRESQRSQEVERAPANPNREGNSKQQPQQKQQQQPANHQEQNKQTPQKQQQQQQQPGQQQNGEQIVTIEVCENCHQHQWNTQHDESKYQGLYEAIKAQLLAHPDHKFQVFRNVNPKNPAQQIQPRRGAFEILLNGSVVYSKIKTTLFPAPSHISTRISKFIEDMSSGGDVTKYENSKEKKMQPAPKPIDEAAVMGKYFVAIKEEQNRQARLREQEELDRIESERQEEEKKRIQLEEEEKAKREAEEEEERQRVREEEEVAQQQREQEAEEECQQKIREAEEEEERQRQEELKQYNEAEGAENDANKENAHQNKDAAHGTEQPKH